MDGPEGKVSYQTAKQGLAIFYQPASLLLAPRVLAGNRWGKGWLYGSRQLLWLYDSRQLLPGAIPPKP
jgi:hypothetical protein